MKFRFAFRLLPVLLLLAAFGCSNNYFGPFAVPMAYEVIPSVQKDQRDVTAELKALQHPVDRPYLISAMDKFNISVYENTELNMLDLVVTPDGYLSVPLIGPIKVGGMTLPEANQAITQALSRYIRDPKVALIPVYVGGYNYIIAGRVNEPGCYPINIGKTRLIDAVAMAKGFAHGLYQGSTVELADLDNAYIVRNGKILPVNFHKALLEGDPLNNIPLENGDYIYIPSVMNSSVAVLGEVGQQTYVGYRDGMTLLQALPFARGLLPSHNSYVKIIRGGMKDPVMYTVNVDLMLEGKMMDFQLQANDIVYVPRSPVAEWNFIVSKVMPTLQGLNMLAGPFGSTAGYFDLNN